MDDLLNFILNSIVAEPEALEVQKMEDNFSLTYLLDAAPGDIGKIIGKSGRTINSITNILNLAYLKGDAGKKRIVIRIKETV